MTISEIIDILLIHIYKENNKFCKVSSIINSENLDLNILDEELKHLKLESLDLFDFNSPSSEEIGVMDIFLYPNRDGRNFVKKYETYSNYLNETKIQQEKEQKNNRKKEKWAIKDAIGSYYGLFTNIIAVVVTIIFGIYSCQKDDKIKTLELKNDSLNAELNTKAKLLEQLQHKFETPKQTSDTLKRTTNQAL